MFHQTEAKAQTWRAVAVFGDDRGEALILIGRSSTQVRQNYAESFLELFDEEERDMVESVSLQRWHGAPDAGRWMSQAVLKVPAGVAKLARAAA
jgi:hypothetical protein